MNNKIGKASQVFQQRVKNIFPHIMVDSDLEVENEHALTHKVFFGKYSWEMMEKVEDITLDIEDEFGITIHIHPMWQTKLIQST